MGADRVRIGTSGWSYADWKGDFYPKDLAQRKWLSFYAEHFATVELNNAFYRLPEYDTFAGWHDQLSEGFVVALKASRFLTHIKRLRDPEEPVGRLFDHARGLGDRLGPILLQLPPRFRPDLDRLSACLDAFPKGTRVVVEPRDERWLVDETRRVLADHDAALCWADRKGRPVGPLWKTASWGYLRLHEGRAHPSPHYGRQALRSWVERIFDTYGKNPDCYIYFNNDTGCAAPKDAEVFRDLCQKASRG